MAHFSPRSFISRRWWTRYRRGRFGLDGAAEPDGLAGVEEAATEELLALLAPLALLALLGLSPLLAVPEVAVLALVAVGVAGSCSDGLARRERATWVPVWWPGSCSWPADSLARDSTTVDSLDLF
jgi:hypothetical protein